MNVTSEQLDDFYRFGTEQIATTPMSWEELFLRWESLNQRDQINIAIREGIQEVNAEKSKPVEEVLRSLRNCLEVEGNASSP